MAAASAWETCMAGTAPRRLRVVMALKTVDSFMVMEDEREFGFLVGALSGFAENWMGWVLSSADVRLFILHLRLILVSASPRLTGCNPDRVVPSSPRMTVEAESMQSHEPCRRCYITEVHQPSLSETRWGYCNRGCRYQTTHRKASVEIQD
ncbi:hypothetical protein BDV28DRAFT_41504 [Aspergillus coremiiformis]|uniref:Uncharacterized protein n=1 Tax=Aspergillus coremiiformis TaxID=138285 RepID=A0A5N6ZGP4_9EURO|nr:hypothetical protein BDV28DRAFT_41504 [Aspergillus coremiiformis]